MQNSFIRERRKPTRRHATSDIETGADNDVDCEMRKGILMRDTAGKNGFAVGRKSTFGSAIFDFISGGDNKCADSHAPRIIRERRETRLSFVYTSAGTAIMIYAFYSIGQGERPRNGDFAFASVLSVSVVALIALFLQRRGS